MAAAHALEVDISLHLRLVQRVHSQISQTQDTHQGSFRPFVDLDVIEHGHGKCGENHIRCDVDGCFVSLDRRYKWQGRKAYSC